MITKQYKIPADKISEVINKLRRLARKCDRLGLSPLTWVVGDQFTEPYYEFVGTDHPAADKVTGCIMMMRPYRNIEVSPIIVKLNGWSFVARIEHLSTDSGFVNVLYTNPTGPSIDTSVYHTVSPNCEHCKAKRNRKDTFIVQHDDKSIKQVGSSCMGDFLGIGVNDFMARAEYASALNAIFNEDNLGSSGRDRTHAISYVLRVAAASVTMCGYISKAVAADRGTSPTSDHVRSFLGSAKWDEVIPDRFFAESKELHESTLKFCENLAEQDMATLSDYFRNIAVIMKAGYCPDRAIGILGSAVAAYMKTKEREASAKLVTTTSTHQGVVGQKIGLSGPLLLTVVIGRPTSSQYGEGSMIKFVDPSGNLYLWFSTSTLNCVGLDEGDQIDAIAVVKKHDTDRYAGNQPITLINRVIWDEKSTSRQRKKFAKTLQITNQSIEC